MKRFLSLALALMLMLSCVNLNIFVKAAASEYISTSYASYLRVKTSKTTPLKTEPNDSGSAKYTLPSDTMLSVKALHKNTAGTYYYEVLFYNMTLYVAAADCTLVDHLTGDVTITDPQSPASLAYGASFSIKGTITSSKNIIGKITAGMYINQHRTQVPAISASATVNGKSYNLASSAIDSNLLFNRLEPGVYDYAVTVEAISYYINESGALDTSSRNVVVETQQCVVTDWTNPNTPTAFGIDVSVWNGYIDWASLKSSIDYAILRIGWEETLDTRFLEYAKGCEDNDIPYGVYIYSYAETYNEGVGEAEFVLNTLKTYGFDPELPIWFDMEDAVHTALSSSMKNQVVRGFCDTILEGGEEPGLYTFISWFRSYFTDSYYDSLPKWIAQIDGFSSNGTSTFDGGTWMWQFSWEGSYSAISSANTDENYYYANFADFNADTTYLSKCTAYPAHFNGKTTSSLTLRQYPSTSYSSLGTVSSGSTVEVTGLYKNSSGGYWYQINHNGTNGYIDAGYVTPVSYLYDDISILSPTMASNLSVGASCKLQGEMISKYNNIYTANAKIYSGEDTLASPVLTSSDNCDKNYYDLEKSKVDNGLAFNNLSAGYYTYELSADVRNYYISGGTLKYQTKNVVVWTAPFTVGSASITPPANLVCTHSLVTDPAVAPGCSTTGLTAGSHCSKCGLVVTKQEVVPAAGHLYTYTVIPATSCNTCDRYAFTCGSCGHTASYYANQLTNQWLDLPLERIDTNLFYTQTQYRYSDYETITSTDPVLEGYTQIGSDWILTESGSAQYVKTWASGFKTSDSTYNQYNQGVTAGETETTKTVVESDEHIGYLWYHWCDTSVTSSWAYETDPYHTFHTYYGTTAPSNYTCDTSDMSYRTAHSSCSNATYWFPMDVYRQSYTKYQKQYTYEHWTDFSDWSATPVSAGSTRKVETRTVYKLKTFTMGEHSYVNGKCSVCGAEDPGYVAISPDYYLFGLINGASYGCDEDYANLGTYKFVDGKLTVTFDTDSYVGIKNGNNLDFYMTSGWLGTNTKAATLYHLDALSSPEKLYVPGGKEVTFTLVVNNNDTLALSYTVKEPVVVPTLSPKYPSLAFEDEIYINVFFAASDLGTLTTADMGLLTWSTARTEGTIHDAEVILPGATWSSAEGFYLVRTAAIPAKNLGDTVYFKIYLKLTDGSYLYTKLLNYSPKTYALNTLSTSSNPKEKALAVAMLNYGAAAQTYFSYKPYNLMNGTLTAAQKALVKGYSSGMVDAVDAVNSSKVGIFANTGGFSRKYPAITFDGAFAIDYFFVPSNTPNAAPKLYYWTEEAYRAASTLTPGNASGCIQMQLVDGQYEATVTGIAAKDLDSTIYVAAGYNSGSKSYCSGVLAYSIGAYCVSQSSIADAMQPFAQATAVYGYYAKAYFVN